MPARADIPTPEPTPVTLKGLENQEIQVFYKSNSKHTPGANGWRPNAGREPRNSLDLFKESVPIPSNNAVRYAQDENGHIHRFSISNNNEWHWSGGTGDIRNPLQLDNKVKSDLRRLGWKGRVLR